MATSFLVKIDGAETVLTLQGLRYAVCPVYHTPRNTSAHTFSTHLKTGDKFRANGHYYEVIGPWDGSRS